VVRCIAKEEQGYADEDKILLKNSISEEEGMLGK
jgi:hypothetical protein